MKISTLILSLLLLVFSLNAQQRTISGKIIDSESKTGLAGTHLKVISKDSQHTVYQGISNKDGGFSIKNLPNEKLSIGFSFMGYQFLTVDLEAGTEDISNLEISMSPSAVEVGEVIVSATRKDGQLRNVSLPLSVVQSNFIEKQPAVTLADLFRDQGGVNITRDGIWATSLNIRGLSEQRIVSLVDGNRIETATDIAAGLDMVDLSDIERVEIIKGAASSLYGTGAMGGVVNIITKEGHYHDKLYFGGSASAAFQSVNMFQSENASLDFANQNWYVRLSGTLRDAGNAMTPEGELLNSQFTDNNISAKIGVKPFKNHELNLNLQSFNAHDVGIPGGSAFPDTSIAIARYTLVKRNMVSAAYSINFENRALEKIKIKYFQQYILRDVELKPNAIATLLPSGRHSTKGIQIQSDWNFGPSNQLIGGIDVWQRYLSTDREKIIVSGGNTTVRGEVPIPDAWFTSIGGFIQDQQNFYGDRLNIRFGGRFDLINTRNDQAVDPLYVIVNGVRNDSPGNQRITFEANNINNYSWSVDAGALYHLKSNADLTLSVSKAYRAPSLEERFKYIDLGSTVRLGDPNLKPEQGYFIDLGSRIWLEKFQLTANVFANSMSNLIVESPGIFIYNYSANPANYDTLNALVNSNIQKAFLYGFDGSLAYNIYDGFTLKANAGFVRGINKTDNSDLPQIPPFNGRLSLKYSLLRILNAELSANYSSEQNKIASNETKTDRFVTYDLGINSVPVNLWKFTLDASAGIQNIGDKAYMLHLSTNRGIIKYEPGRNFYLKIRMNF